VEGRLARGALFCVAPKRLAAANIPAAVLVAPIIPAINDAELEATLARARAMGARDAGYVLLRLPLEVRERFAERHRD
jgi:DNA repair photolyase